MKVLRGGAHREQLAAAAWIVVLVAATLLLHPHRDDIEPGTAALLLIVAPLVAALGSLRLSLVAAVVSALAFNYWFTEPYDSLRISSDTSVAAFVVYLVIAAALGGVIDLLRREAETSRRQTVQSELVRDLTIDLVRQKVWMQPAVASALAELADSLGLRGAALPITIAGGESFVSQVGDSARALDAARELSTSLAPAVPGVHEAVVRRLRDAHGVSLWPVASGDVVYGVLAIDTGDEPLEGGEQTARSFANVVALACERASLVHATIERRTLEETDRLRTTLMQSVTHDLRTPLTSIRALASALPELAPITTEQQELVDEIESQSERLARLVDQVLDLGRIERGELRPRLANLAVDDLLLATVAALGPRRGEVEVSIEPDLPPVPVDEPLMQQVVLNLVENALRHGGAPIELRARARGAVVEIAVVDHGKGIPEAERRRMFEPTWAMRRPSADERSRGLGLAISAGFVEAHAGRLHVETTPGGGATFVITLPSSSQVEVT